MAGKPTRLESRLFSGSDELVNICLPDWFRNALLSLTERMTWTKVWRLDDGSEYSLTEEDVTRIEFGIYQLTRDDCGILDEDMLDEILTRLEELEQMNINVNCGCGCGCSGQSQPPIEEGVVIDDLCPPQDLPETAPPQTAVTQKCDLSNYFVVQIRTTLLNEWARAQSWPEFKGWWENLFVFLPQVYIVQQTYSTYVAVSQWLAGKAVDWITGNFDPLFNEMVCALYQSISPSQAQSSLFVVLDKLPYPLSESAKAIAQRLPYSALFAPDIVSPPGFANRECCGQSPGQEDVQPLPEAPAGYFWATVQDGEFDTVPNNGTGQVSYNAFNAQFMMQPLTTNSYHEVQVNVDISDLTDRLVAAGAHGLLLQFVSPPVEQYNNNGIQLSSNTGGTYLAPVTGGTLMYYDNAEYVAVTEFSDFIDGVVANIKYNYGNGAMDDNKASFRMQSYGTSGAETIRAVIAYLLKES